LKECLQKSGWDRYVCEKIHGFISTNPSVVQHIGKAGSFSNGERYDKAGDFIGKSYLKINTNIK